MDAAWKSAADARTVTRSLLSDARLWGEDLTRLADLGRTGWQRPRANPSAGVKAAMAEL